MLRLLNHSLYAAQPLDLTLYFVCSLLVSLVLSFGVVELAHCEPIITSNLIISNTIIFHTYHFNTWTVAVTHQKKRLPCKSDNKIEIQFSHFITQLNIIRNNFNQINLNVHLCIHIMVICIELYLLICICLFIFGWQPFFFIYRCKFKARMMMFFLQQQVSYCKLPFK